MIRAWDEDFNRRIATDFATTDFKNGHKDAAFSRVKNMLADPRQHARLRCYEEFVDLVTRLFQHQMAESVDPDEDLLRFLGLPDVKHGVDEKTAQDILDLIDYLCLPEKADETPKEIGERIRLSLGDLAQHRAAIRPYLEALMQHLYQQTNLTQKQSTLAFVVGDLLDDD